MPTVMTREPPAVRADGLMNAEEAAGTRPGGLYRSY